MFLQNWIDKDEQYIRKRWLGFSIACAAFPVFLSIIFGKNYYLIYTIPFPIIIFVMLYYLAYRKPGTHLLIFIMSLKLLNFFLMPDIAYNFLNSGFRILNYCAVSIDCLINLGWFFLSFQIIKINIRKQLLSLQNCMDEEQGIRNRWLIFSIAYAVYSIINLIIMGENIYFGIYLHVVILALLYHFAYRKSGTLVLKFIMLLKLAEFIKVLYLLDMLFGDCSILTYYSELTDIFINLGWFFLSFQLTEINTRRERCLSLQNCIDEEQYIRDHV